MAAEGGAVCRVWLAECPPPPREAENSCSRAAADDLAAWLWGEKEWPRGHPLRPQGSPFQQRVWNALLQIPAGSQVTYGELAKRLGTAPRAVGGACRANPIPLLIPCHRVVAAQGLGGFAGRREGRWVAFKQWLLTHE